MLKMMGKKIFTILRSNFCLSKPVCICDSRYEQGMRASLGQDLSGLREQQNQINQNLGDIMDSIENHTEEPK